MSNSRLSKKDKLAVCMIRLLQRKPKLGCTKPSTGKLDIAVPEDRSLDIKLFWIKQSYVVVMGKAISFFKNFIFIFWFRIFLY